MASWNGSCLLLQQKLKVARLKDNGNNYEVGRDEFLECWKWTNEHASIIKRTMGKT